MCRILKFSLKGSQLISLLSCLQVNLEWFSIFQFPQTHPVKSWWVQRVPKVCMFPGLLFLKNTAMERSTCTRFMLVWLLSRVTTSIHISHSIQSSTTSVTFVFSHCTSFVFRRWMKQEKDRKVELLQQELWRAVSLILYPRAKDRYWYFV